MTKPLGQINIFAVQRSGGTILNLFLREFVCEKCSLLHPQLLKEELNPNSYGPNNLFLYRHPFGILGSMLHVDSIDIKRGLINVEKGNAKIKIHNLKERLNIFYSYTKLHAKEGIEIRYEDFYNNFEYLRYFVGKNYNVDISDEQLEKFTSDFSADSIAKDMISGTKKIKDFRPFHVSSGKGDNRANLKLIPSELRNESKIILQEFVDQMNYETFDLSEIPSNKNYELNKAYS